MSSTGSHDLPRIVSENEQLSEAHRGSIYVQPGATFIVSGSHQWSLHVETGAAIEILPGGSHRGSLHVDRGGRAVIQGEQQGSLHIEGGGEVTVGISGRAAGSVHNEGIFAVAGEQGGEITGAGETRMLETARIKHPIRRDNTNVYDWS
jgi:hypothetical protein